jgi:Chaperone of endosialidase
MKRIFLSLITSALLAPSAFAQATSHERINYQAYVLQSNGTEYGDGTPTNYTVQFRIYSAATGGTELWAEQQTVTIHDGRFSVLLGNGTAIPSINHDALSTIFAAAVGGAPQNRYIGVKIGSAAEFAPRQQLVANPIAMRAASAAVADTVAGNSINAAAIADASITGADLAAGAVVAANLADNAVTTNKLNNLAVTEGKLGAGAVTEGKLGAGAVTEVKLGAGAVTEGKLGAGAVTSGKLSDLAVTEGKLGAGAVTSTKIGPDAVGNSAMADNSVGPFEIANNFASLSKVSGGRLTIATGAAPLEINAAAGNDWDIRLGGTGIRHSSQNFFEVTNAASANGGVTSGTLYARLNNQGEWSRPSDRRLKRDIAPLHGLLDKALTLEPVTYHYNSDAAAAALHIGFIAQDVQAVVPSLVTEGEILTLNYAGMGTIAIGAIKEQHAIVKDQGGRIETLEKENADLKARLERLEQALGTIK